MRKTELAMVIGLIAAIFLGSLSELSGRLQTLSDSVLRLHILAASDTAEDQRLKLCVRDALLAESETIFAGCDTSADMQARARLEQDTIQEIAERTLRDNGCTDPVTVELVRMAFDERQYDDLTMPAGTYDAIRILIGEGQGHNWWCVMYPPLCLPSAVESAEDCFDDETVDLLTRPQRYEVRFKCVELWEQLCEKLSRS